MKTACTGAADDAPSCIKAIVLQPSGNLDIWCAGFATGGAWRD